MHLSIQHFFHTAKGSAFIILDGFRYVLRSGWIKKYIAASIVLNFISFLLTILIVFLSVNQLAFYLLQELQITTDIFLASFIQALVFVIALVIGVISFTTISSIISAPVWGLISERLIDEQAKNTSSIEMVKRTWIGEISYTASFQSKRLLLIASILLLSLPLNLIPIAGQILFSTINLIQLVVITGLDLFDPIWSKSAVKFRTRLKTIIMHPAKYWPFLLIAGTLSSIPVLNILTMPICITAAILLEVNPEHTQKRLK